MLKILIAHNKKRILSLSLHINCISAKSKTQMFPWNKEYTFILNILFFLYLFLYIYLFIYLLIYLFISLFNYLFFYLFIYLFIFIIGLWSFSPNCCIAKSKGLSFWLISLLTEILFASVAIPYLRIIYQKIYKA